MSKIFIYDEFGPEDTAMMQALYSRSPKSVEEHVEKVKATGSGKFMETFYVGYGHSSIADCGSTTIFIEGLSILADKAVQDWQMYSGQETSTRYVDMGKQAIIDPVASTESALIIKRWMDFYISSQEPLQAFLMSKYPKKDNEDQAVYEKAIKARAFDITRGFLPAGITTQLSWHTNLRQAYDKLSLMRYNPLPEVKQIAEDILSQLKEKYPHSFSHQLYPEQEAYREQLGKAYSFFQNPQPVNFALSTNIKNEDLQNFSEVVANRPIKTNLPLALEELGLLTFDFTMDYGSFRDVQRHRHGFCRMPLLSTDLGFNTWYLEQLPEDLRTAALALITEQKAAIRALEASAEIKQYYVAMGFDVACRVSYTLPATVYVTELRSGKLVHPTLRKVAHQMRQALLEKLPDLKLHCDMDMDDWDVRRGLQDIVKK